MASMPAALSGNLHTHAHDQLNMRRDAADVIPAASMPAALSGTLRMQHMTSLN